jgi:hypothetical protein
VANIVGVTLVERTISKSRKIKMRTEIDVINIRIRAQRFLFLKYASQCYNNKIRRFSSRRYSEMLKTVNQMTDVRNNCHGLFFSRGEDYSTLCLSGPFDVFRL